MWDGELPLLARDIVAAVAGALWGFGMVLPDGFRGLLCEDQGLSRSDDGRPSGPTWKGQIAIDIGD